jgi:hypothetical protein
MPTGATRMPFLTVAALSIAILGACRVDTSGPAPAAAPAAQTAAVANASDPVERGRYLVAILGCGDCHTPLVMGPQGPMPDPKRLLAGHPESLAMPPAPPPSDAWAWHGAATNTAFAGPWGVSYATNLTPDETTGLGPWSEEIFVNTIRTGKHWGQSRPILPPMPWLTYARMTDGDLKSVYAYLRTVPAITNQPPQAIIAEVPAAH